MLGVLGFAAMLVIAAGAALLREAPSLAPADTPAIGNIRTIDGDTLEIGGMRVRLADIDAPELFSPQCAAERALAERARIRLAELVSAGPVTLSGTGKDLYRRELRVVLAAGQSVGLVLVHEGLAREWTGRREPWC